MAPKRPNTRDTLAKNLKMLLQLRGWNQVQLAAKSGVSQRMISSVLAKQSGCSVETADALAQPFGLTGWQLILPNLSEDLVRSGAVASLVDSYMSASPEGRALIDAMALREAKLASD